MITSICIVGLLEKYTKKVAKRVADALEMFYADVNELLSYDFIDIIEAENIVGKDYILKQETNKIKTLSSYENTVITLDYKSLNNEKNLKFLKQGSIIIYLKLNKPEYKIKLADEKLKKDEADLALKMFVERDKVLKGYSNIVVLANGTITSVVKTILNKIEEYYEKR